MRWDEREGRGALSTTVRALAALPGTLPRRTRTCRSVGAHERVAPSAHTNVSLRRRLATELNVHPRTQARTARTETARAPPPRAPAAAPARPCPCAGPS
eukprot:6193655-Pleurochrysis_carterae.AAC.2